MIHAKWLKCEVPEVSLSFRMPLKPTQILMTMPNGQQLFMYRVTSSDGFFQAAYAFNTSSLQEMIKSRIQTDPGNQLIQLALSSATKGFARVLHAEIIDPKFGMDRGLPTEFSEVRRGGQIFHLRVYLGSKAIYLFTSVSEVKAATYYFNSIKLPGENFSP